MNKKHANIPIFIPHEGCPNDCVFCNQHKITGRSSGADRDIRPEIEAALATIDTEKYDTEIAFFGGSFTGIDRDVMKKLLACAYGYIKDGKVSSVRLSTRPDYIDGEILGILSEYGVRHIELGIQSVNDNVLSACRRGHTFSDTEKACRLITSHGFILGGQMMVGLPGASVFDELKTAQTICELGAKEARIYPTVVFTDTELCRMAKSGQYTPITNDEAGDRCAACYRIFLKNGVKVLRVGLQSGENLSSADEVFAGANHSAIGEICEGRVYLSLIKDSLKALLPSYRGEKTLVIEAPFGEVSKVSGHKKENKTALSAFLAENGADINKIIITEAHGEKFRVNTRFS